MKQVSYLRIYFVFPKIGHFPHVHIPYGTLFSQESEGWHTVWPNLKDRLWFVYISMSLTQTRLKHTAGAPSLISNLQDLCCWFYENGHFALYDLERFSEIRTRTCYSQFYNCIFSSEFAGPIAVKLLELYLLPCVRSSYCLDKGKLI